MIEFFLNDKHIKTDLNPGMTLLDFVRYEQRLTGSKIGCREGDCGACSVLVGSINEHENIDYESITSCISPLGNAHGKHIVTIEGTNLINKLNKAQQAMKENYATQCGFCTPGFVVSLTGFAMSNREKTYQNALDAISGNICRCTGYKSIERAAKSLSESIEIIDSTKSPDWLIDREFIPDYFSGMADKLKALKTEAPNYSNGTFVSGGTDLYVQKADDLIENDVHLIFDQPELKSITIENDMCILGAGCTVTDIWNHKKLNKIFPKLKKHLKLVSSEPIRNMASFGGNLVNASPIGDMTIFFLALNSNIVIKNSEGSTKSLALNEFYKGYKTYDLKPGELIKEIQFKLPDSNSKFNFEKVCKRTHLDIASVNTALSLKNGNGTISEVHLAIGGVAAIPKYLFGTSQFLNCKTINHQLILDANAILQEEILPISDVRGSANYKRLLARQLLFAHFIELFPDQIQLKKLVLN